MIQIHGLKLKAGSFRIDDLDFMLQEGVFNILLGPTGSGKTLILESIMGLHQIQSGRIVLGEKAIQNLPPEKRGIAYLPQDLALFPHLTVRENLLYGLRAQKKRVADNNDHLERLIEVLRISHLLNRYPQGLSGGEKQRVALGRALAVSPKLLLMDEPLVALDPALKSEIQQLFLSLHHSLGFTALYVTHDLEEAYLLGDTITVLIGGKIEQKGTRQEVFLKPRNVKVAQFLGLRNLFLGQVSTNIQDEGTISIDLWGRKITLPAEHPLKDFSPGEKVIVYLRPEEVLILREGKPIKEALQQYILTGEVFRILDRGTYQWVLFKSLGQNMQLLEIHLPNYVFRNLSIREGQTIRVAMRKESFWLIPEKGTK